MILVAKDIAKAKRKKQLNIRPYNAKHLNANSYQLHLGKYIGWYDLPPGTVFDLSRDMRAYYKEMEIPKEGVVLDPNKFYLGVTREWTACYEYIPLIEGTSSLARVGITAHVTASYGDLGFCGHWTLEIKNVQCYPIRIFPGMPIGKILFQMPSDSNIKSLTYYKGKYKNQYDKDAKPVPSAIHEKFKKSSVLKVLKKKKA